MSNAFNLSQLANNVNSSGLLSASAGVTGTLPIANGGTNSTATATNGGVAYGTGTAIAVTAAGTSGYVLTSSGASAPTWAAASGGGQLQSVLYTSGTSTWTAPTGVTKVMIFIAGGGGGGAFWIQGCAGTSGGNGAQGIVFATVSPGTGYTVTIGAGGASVNTNGGGTGGTGGTSSFGSIVTCTGGTGGRSFGGTIIDGVRGSFSTTATAINAYAYMLNGYATNTTTSVATYNGTNGYTAGSPGYGQLGFSEGGTGGAILIQYVG
jgi:hypothetical protein